MSKAIITHGYPDEITIHIVSDKAFELARRVLNLPYNMLQKEGWQMFHDILQDENIQQKIFTQTFCHETEKLPEIEEFIFIPDDF